MDVKGRDLVSGIPKTVTRALPGDLGSAFRSRSRLLWKLSGARWRSRLPELSSDIADRGIVMTGGGALIRGLDRLLQHETNLPIHLDEEPLTCVVRGAGHILDDMQKYRNVLAT